VLRRLAIENGAMGYRDDLAATRARISALEAELAVREESSHSVAVVQLRRQRDDLMARVSELEERLAETKEEAGELRAAMRSPKMGMKTLTEHNREIPTKRRGHRQVCFSRSAQPSAIRSRCGRTAASSRSSNRTTTWAVYPTRLCFMQRQFLRAATTAHVSRNASAELSRAMSARCH
jgi:BMFP domain-containing protein YqiC